LEHTNDFEMIIQEFERIFKPYGLCIVAFAISIDRSDKIPKGKALKLIESLEKHFFA
jgi:hypothetical protein